MKKKPKDQHASNFLVRLPEGYRAKLKDYRERTGCPIAEAVRRAVDLFLLSQSDPRPDTST